MACSSCRQPTRVNRSPNQAPAAPVRPTNSQIVNTSPQSGDQRSKIVGLTYVPKR